LKHAKILGQYMHEGVLVLCNINRQSIIHAIH